MPNLPLELFGGLVTDTDAPALPSGVSPDCQDCAFFPAVVRTRPGLASQFAAIAGNPTINYLRTFVEQTLEEVMLALDSNGVLWGELSTGTLTAISANPASAVYAAPPRGKSDTLFGREYLATGDGQFGNEMPRQYDGTYLDRVSQSGPGAPLIGSGYLADNSIPLTALSRASYVIAGTTASAHGLQPGDLVTIAGVTSDNTFNGTFPVYSTPSSTQFLAWGCPGEFAISSIVRNAGVVTAQLSAGGSQITAGQSIIVGDVTDSSYNGQFTVTGVSGNTIEWAQAGTETPSSGGLLYIEQIIAPIIAMYQAGSGNIEIATSGIGLQGFVAGGQVIVAGSSVSGNDGTYTITAVQLSSILGNSAPTETTNATYLEVAGTASGTGYAGTAQSSVADDASPTTAGAVAGLAGSITAGIHQMAVCFVTRQGYITPPSPPVNWTAQGNFQVKISGIALALEDTNIVARILLFTAANGDTFYYTTGTSGTPQMRIDDNSTTTITLDFSDSTLLAGTPAAELFNLEELREAAGVIAYSERLFWWGTRASLTNLLNLSFDGGFDGNRPLGWTTDPAYGTGGLRDSSSIWGGAYDIIGDGATALRGMITQPAAADYYGVPIIPQNTAMSVRVRVRSVPGGSPLTQGNLEIELYSPTAGSLGKLTVTTAQVNALPSNTFGEFIGSLIGAQATVPADLLLRVYGSGTVNASAGFQVDQIVPFPTNAPYDVTTVRASLAGDPESYDGVSGLLSVAPENGEAVRAAFIHRNVLHLVKEHSLYSTEDPGTGEPATWTINEVSREVGTVSIHGVDVGEDWAVIADLAGLYMFAGGEPIKISQEIQSLWDGINWEYGYTLWVKVDRQNMRILVGAPVNGATSPNIVLMMDYRGLVTASSIIESPPLHFSPYSGKWIAIPVARKWCPWQMAANCCDLIYRPDGTMRMFLGNGAGTGKIYELSDTQYSDDGAAIASYYATYFAPSHTDEQTLQLPSRRKLFAYLSLYALGSGTLDISAFLDNSSREVSLASVTLLTAGAACNLTGAARLRNVVTVTAPGLVVVPGMLVTLAGVSGGATSLNGTFPVQSALSPGVFTFFQLGPDESATPNTGTATTIVRDAEQMTNFLAERASFQVGTNAVGSWFRLERFIPTVEADPWAPVRGGGQ